MELRMGLLCVKMSVTMKFIVTPIVTQNGADASDYQWTIMLCDGVTIKTQLFQKVLQQNLCSQLHKYNKFWRTLFYEDEKKC